MGATAARARRPAQVPQPFRWAPPGAPGAPDPAEAAGYDEGYAAARSEPPSARARYRRAGPVLLRACGAPVPAGSEHGYAQGYLDGRADAAE